jgi:Pentapeptide repeats (8 copies)
MNAEPLVSNASRRFKFCLRRGLRGVYLAAFLLFQGVIPYGFAGEPAETGDPLVQAQIENQKAQARYYSRQSDRRGFWVSLREFGLPVGVIAVGVAAIVAVWLNQRANLRSRLDTEFYETIRLFGQNENPHSRLIAAGVLAQMALRRNRFYECAFDQLSLGLLTEPQEQVRDAIRLAVQRLVKRNPGKSLQKLDAMNGALRTSLIESLYRFFVARGGDPPRVVAECDWIQAEQITEFDRPTLQSLLDSFTKDRAAQTVSAAKKPGNDGKNESAVEERARSVLANAAEKLRLNVKLIGESLFYVNHDSERPAEGILSDRKVRPHSFSSTFLAVGEFRTFESCRLYRAVLRNANMATANLERASLLEVDLCNADLSYARLRFVDCRDTKLTGAILRHADLSGAKIQNTDLSGADLTNTIFRNTHIAPEAFQGTEWWKADFGRQRNLLKSVYAHLKKELPDLEHLYVRGEIHRSVLDFIGRVTEERL